MTFPNSYSYRSEQSTGQHLIADAAARYFTAKAQAFLERGRKSLDQRTYCNPYPAFLICAAAEAHMESQVPDLGINAKPARRDAALTSIQPYGIYPIGYEKSLCFSGVMGAIASGRLLEPANAPTEEDPIPAGTAAWAVDRISQVAQHVADRLASGQRI